MLTIENPQNETNKANPRGRPVNPLVLQKRPDGRLWAKRDGKDVAVKLKPCLPLTYPKKYISVQDDRDNEVAMIHNLSDLDTSVSSIVEQELESQAAIREVVSVLKLTTLADMLTWEVLTKQGLMKFQTKRGTKPAKLSECGLLIRSVAGELLHIEDLRALDWHSRSLLTKLT